MSLQNLEYDLFYCGAIVSVPRLLRGILPRMHMRGPGSLQISFSVQIVF